MSAATDGDADDAERDTLLGPEDKDDGKDCASVYEHAGKDEVTRDNVLCEMAKVGGIAWPIAATFMLQSSSQQFTIILVGHLGAQELGAASMANMWINITGMSFIYGGMSAFDTLGSQAFGARNFHLVGLLAQRCLAQSTLLCIPISLSWWYATGPVLVAVGIEEETAALAATFARFNLFTIWPILAHNVLQRFLRSQGVVRPTTLIVAISSVLFLPVAWLLVDTFGFIGAPLANAALNWFLLLALSTMTILRGMHKKCWGGWSWQAFSNWWPMVKIGAAGVMGNMYVPRRCPSLIHVAQIRQ